MGKNCLRNLSSWKSSISSIKTFGRTGIAFKKFKPDEFWEISFNAQNDKNHGIVFNLNRKN